MSKNLSQQPITVANASGFPLQIGISHVVNKSNRWKIFLEEHPWSLDDKDDKVSEGFIDLVVYERFSQFETLVIECKRVRQTAWVFLLPTLPSAKRSQATIFGSQLADSKWKHFGWEDWQADPITYQSQYCAIPGQQQGRKNLIEHTASELVLSVEALANQERRLQQENGADNFSRVYIPIIVTTAQLFIAEFDPSNISLEDGCLPKNTPFFEVPFIRYRKSLATFGGSILVKSISEFHIASERTIFVVNALKFEEFLNQYDFRD
jgi:hypothetical protein